MKKISLVVASVLLSLVGFVSADLIVPGQIEIPKNNISYYLIIPVVALVIFVLILLRRRKK